MLFSQTEKPVYQPGQKGVDILFESHFLQRTPPNY